MILKSRTSLLDEIVTTVKENHPYDTPEVIGVPVFGGSKDYINWVLENTKEPN
jgi:periplasmic divalent cation tolerance protein